MAVGETAETMTWLSEYADVAEKTDRLVGKGEHLYLLAAGLMGEAGSVLAELKKAERESNAYPGYRCRIVEEVGDFLWYFTRIVTVVDRALLQELDPTDRDYVSTEGSTFSHFLAFGATVGDVLAAANHTRLHEMRPLLQHVWTTLVASARHSGVDLREAASLNAKKIESRWPRPEARVYAAPFDDHFPEEEQLPRRIEIEFMERSYSAQRVVLLRCNGVTIGDRLTDNIEDPDWYRYHDIFHFAHAVHLGWSPVVRSLLRCKRKSNAKTDEAQDGARAIILEEAVAAIVFSRAKELDFFQDVDQIDYDLLKTVKQFIRGYEVDKVPLWQWEAAILDGYATFRDLKSNKGGTVGFDLHSHKLTYFAPNERGDS